MAHVAAATAFQNENIELADSEGERLAEAVKKVLRHYDIPDVASETKDWIGLIIACGAVYGPRLSASWAEKRMKKQAAQAEHDGSNVLNMTVAQ